MCERREEIRKSEEALIKNIGKIAYTLDHAYLKDLSTESIVCFENYNEDDVVGFPENIRAFKVDRWVFDRDEKAGDCLKNLFSLFADGDHTLAVVITRKVNYTDMYFVVKNCGAGRNADSDDNASLLKAAIEGNFPGSSVLSMNSKETKEQFSFEKSSAVSVLINNPTQYSEGYLSQGLEKLLNGIAPTNEEEEYSIVFVAESVKQEQIREVLSGYEELASDIAPFLAYQFQIGSNRQDTGGEMHSTSKSRSTSKSISKTHSINASVNASVSKNLSVGIASKIIPASISAGTSKGASAGYGYSWTIGKTDTEGKTETNGTNSSVSIGASESTTYTYKSYLVTNLMERLEKNMGKIQKAYANGLWNFSTYVFSEDVAKSKNIANYVRALSQGQESYSESPAIAAWARESTNGKSIFDEVKKYVSHFTHPIFAISDMDGENDTRKESILVSSSTYISTDEIANVMRFPQKSVPGVQVVTSVQFGREPQMLTPSGYDLRLGCGYHMLHPISALPICVSKKELTKHTFISGSTGSGKTNTVCRLLEQLRKEEVSFLVIEPAKGEYRKKLKGVRTFGTNPLDTDCELLKINPFSFPVGKVHILEHLDRLVELFNVCWPMYAAMPAILKDSIERAYEACGWNIEKSMNEYDNRLFPTFADVLLQIHMVLDESDYSADNKGDYIGSLSTRIRSLTTGINGLVFSSDELDGCTLFDNDAIVDLSKVGASDTKSLIMGLLILKLQEHRSSQGHFTDELEHITVLEEAHNILKRTSTEQVSESANLVGKSVEMLSNAIAEMRAYGEGFVIADQAPGLLDMAVIRNTNTKIIMKLPDLSDRELVGKAIGLTDNQIAEISRLDTGVACINQSGWLEPVLTLIDKFNENDSFFYQGEQKQAKKEENRDSVQESLLSIIMEKELYRRSDKQELEALREDVIKSRLTSSVKFSFLKYLASGESLNSFANLVYEFFSAADAIDKSKGKNNVEDWVKSVLKRLSPSTEGYSSTQLDLLMALILNEQVERDDGYNNLLIAYTEMLHERGVRV